MIVFLTFINADMDSDGVIKYRDLHNALQLILGKNTLSEEHMHTIISKVGFSECFFSLAYTLR